MAFNIASIEARIVDHPIMPSRVVISPAGRHDTSRFVIVTVRDNDGVTGYGEAATTAMWSGETAETAHLVITTMLAPALIGGTFDHPREALALMDKTIHAHPFTKSALDTALWDLWARAQGVHATTLFADREPLESIPSRASVGCYDVPTTLRIAGEFWDAGIRTLKFKIGLPGQDDAARLRAVREAYGDAPVFTVDANGAYATVDEAVAAIEKLLPYNLALVEQPTHRDRIYQLAAVRRRVEVPILADECIFTIDHLRDAIDCEACDYVGLYPGKNGGVTHTLAMAALAQQAGKACAIGCNLETDIGQAAMAAVAAGLSAFPVNDLACDLPGALYYEKCAVRQPLTMKDGRVPVGTGTGFGVEPAI